MQARKPNLVNKAFRQYLWASVLSVAATQIASIVDATIVGNLVSADGLAAVNLSKPLLQTYFAVTCLYVPSATMLAGMSVGKGDRDKANKFFTFTVIVSLILGVIFTVGGLVGFKSLSRALCPSDTIRPLSDTFMRITLFSAVPQMLMLTLQQFVTMDGEPKRVTRAVIVGNVVNILLDIVFIKFFGWGIAGAATATCIMYVVCVLMVLPHFRKKNSVRLCATKFKDVEVGKVLSIGLPFFFSTVLLSVQYIGNNYVANRYLGDNGLVALAVCMQLFAFSMIILNGTLRTIQPVGSILKGMDDSNGMVMLYRRAYRFMAICFAVFAALLVLFPTQIGAMLGVSSEGGMAAVKAALPLFSLHIVMQGLLCDLLPVFQFYGRKGLAMLLSIAQALLPMLFFLLLRGRWIGFFIGQVVTAVAIAVWEMILRRKDRSLCRVLLIPMKEESRLFETTVLPNTESLSGAISSLRSFLTENGRDSHSVNTAAVCAEELVVNIIRHGKASAIDLASSVSDGSIIISIHDDGTAFDPVTALKGDGSVDDVSGGSGYRIGLGLTLAKAFCKDINYKYIFNQNMTTLTI